MLDSLQKDGPILGHEEIQDVRGYTVEFRLDHELTLTLVSGYDIPLRHRVVTRLAELENAKPALDPMQVLNDPAGMRGLLLGYMRNSGIVCRQSRRPIDVIVIGNAA